MSSTIVKLWWSELQTPKLEIVARAQLNAKTCGRTRRDAPQLEARRTGLVSWKWKHLDAVIAGTASGYTESVTMTLTSRGYYRRKASTAALCWWQGPLEPGEVHATDHARADHLLVDIRSTRSGASATGE